MFEDQEQLEFAISQFLDGTLEPEQRAALEQRLAADPAARATLEQYRQLDRTLRAAAPTVNWDKLQTHLSGAVASQEEQDRRAYSIARVRRVGTWAVAACLLIAGAGVLRYFLAQQATVPVPGPVVVAEVSGPAQEQAQGPAVCDVQLGPAPADQSAADADDAIVAPTSRIVIASDQSPPQETRELPY